MLTENWKLSQTQKKKKKVSVGPVGPLLIVKQIKTNKNKN